MRINHDLNTRENALGEQNRYKSALLQRLCLEARLHLANRYKTAGGNCSARFIVQRLIIFDASEISPQTVDFLFHLFAGIGGMQEGIEFQWNDGNRQFSDWERCGKCGSPAFLIGTTIG